MASAIADTTQLTTEPSPELSRELSTEDALGSLSPSARGSIFRYKADRPRVAVFVAIGLLDLAVCLFVQNPLIVLAYCLVSILPKGMTCAFNHHHQHLQTFKNRPLNRCLEVVYALQTGVTTHTWTLHHTVGHHQNYLDQTLDQSRWRRRSGAPMGRIEYSLITSATAYYRAWKTGKDYPKYRATFGRMIVPVVAVVALMVALRPVAGTMVFVITPAVMLFGTAWATYDHHSNRATDPAFGATTNVLQPFYNFWTGNLGYHTAHHFRPSAHWSKVPAIHATIAQHIPADAYLEPGFPYKQLNMMSRLIKSPIYRVPSGAN
jgi:fatty acid desaturase